MDWDADNMDQIEFNDLYEFLYEIKYGEKLNEENVQNGIPKEQFEDVICAFFDISTGDLEVYARYDAETGLYPWEPVGPRNRVSQFLPFPEVVKCVENADGTWTLYVEGIMVIEGDRTYFEMSLLFYEKLSGKTDEFLAEHDYSREEVVDGLKYVVNYYGYGSLLEAFAEDIEL